MPLRQSWYSWRISFIVASRLRSLSCAGVSRAAWSATACEADVFSELATPRNSSTAEQHEHGNARDVEHALGR